LSTDDIGHRQAQHVPASLDGQCRTDHPASISIPLMHAGLHSLTTHLHLHLTFAPPAKVRSHLLRCGDGFIGGC